MEEMDVDTFTVKLNAHTTFRGHEEFTPLEVKTYLQQIDESGKIMMSWKTGKSGMIYNTS